MRIFLCFASLFLCCISAAAQNTSSPPWYAPRMTLHAQDREIADVLRDFSTTQKVPVSVGEQVRGKISGSFVDVDTRKFLDVLCESNGLVWFYDGTRLYVDQSDAVASRVMAFTHLTKEKLEDAIYSVGYASGPRGQEIAVKTGHRKGLLLLVGGPQYIRATEALANDLEAQATVNFEERMEVRTFRLQHASAADMTVRSGEQTTVLPGIARSLNNLMIDRQGQAGPTTAAMTTGPMESTRSNMRPSLKGSGLASSGGNPMIDAGNIANNQPTYPTPQAPIRRASDAVAPNSPTVVVDTRLNAVLVRDYAARMPLYEELIRALDVPTPVVEITAAIVDIDANVGKQLGFELLGVRNKESNLYRFGFDADRGLFDPVDTQGERPSFIEGSNLARGIGLNASALLTGFGYEALTRLRALEQEGKAQVVTSPTILTLENIQAVIRTDETVYVRVAGNMETDLYDVTTGVQFRVTPSLVKEGDNHTFRLAIEITDGAFLNQEVDSIPGTRESSITTQAMVPESTTLLLGGYFVERKTKEYNGVPFLSKIPILKHALSRQDRSHGRNQRYFFITPRLVNLEHEAKPVRLDSPVIPGKTEIPDGLMSKQAESPYMEELSRKMATESIRLRMPDDFHNEAVNGQPAAISVEAEK